MLHDFLEFFHIVFVIAWMAGLLYLPRLFVYHADLNPQSETAKTLSVMESRLLRIIMNPAMILTFISGVWLVWDSFRTDIALWLWLKIALVLGLAAFQGIASRWQKDLAAGVNHRSAHFFRLANEIPTILMILIVALVVFQPF